MDVLFGVEILGNQRDFVLNVDHPDPALERIRKCYALYMYVTRSSAIADIPLSFHSLLMSKSARSVKVLPTS